MKSLRFSIIILLLSVTHCFAQFDVNYSEDKVPEFKLPDPLKTFKGKKIKNVKKWEAVRRPELLEFFKENVYGHVPGELDLSSFEVVEKGSAFNGKAIRKQIELSFENEKQSLAFNILLYLPSNIEKAPLFLGYNFYGNHSIVDDVEVFISEAWAKDNPSFGIVHNQLTEQSRGVRNHRWPVEKIIDAGFGLAVIYYGEIDPDKDDFTDGVHPFFYDDNHEKPASNEWGSIAAWAWGLSKAMDYLQKDIHVDASKVVVFGHSRLGKTALWAGAQDQRFAAVISNNSGCGGAALSKRRFGETVWRINKNFPHWFNENFKNYSKAESKLPVDQHQLLALIAPRPLYVASAEDDKWADPKGEFLAVHYASPVYKLYGKKGIQQENMPGVNKPIQHTLAYHIRSGKHDVTDYDWEQYIKWAKKFVVDVMVPN